MPVFSDELIKKLYCLLQEGLFVIDAAGALVQVNQGFTDLLGYAAADIGGLFFWDLRHDLEGADKRFQALVDTFGLYYFLQAEKSPMTMIMRHRDGHAVSVLLRTAIVRDDAGEMRNGLGIIVPVTVAESPAEVETEAELSSRIWETEQNYKSILEHCGDGVFIADFNSRIVTVNTAAVEMLGYDGPEDIIGRGLIELGPIDGSHMSTTGDVVVIDEDHQQRQIAVANALFETGLVKTELHLFRKDGRVIPLEVTLTLLKDAKGARRGTITLARDITGRKLTEKRLSAAYDELDKKVQERTLSLEETNIALRVLVKGQESERLELEKKIMANINELVLPYLDRLQALRLDERQQTLLDILGVNLREIVVPFADKLSAKYLQLTPAEIQVANLIKQGRTTKQIAGIVNLSPETIETHRKNIRKKLGLQNQKANLRSYLISLT